MSLIATAPIPGDTGPVHASFLLLPLFVGGIFGWVWHGFRYAWLDMGSANRRFRGARKVLQRETLWSLVFVVIAVLIVRALV